MKTCVQQLENEIWMYGCENGVNICFE